MVPRSFVHKFNHHTQFITTYLLSQTIEVHITPERLANIYADDIDSPYAQQLVPIISQAIREQCVALAASIEDDLLESVEDDKSDISQLTDVRIIIKVSPLSYYCN